MYGTPYVTTRPRNFHTESLFSLNFPRIAQNSAELRDTEILRKLGKLREIMRGINRGMEMSLLLCGIMRK